MISYVRGELVDVNENSVIVDNNGIGYLIYVPASIIAKIPPIGSEVRIYTYMYVKEDILDLYGFLTKDDLRVFKLLISVNGIGPKGALNILSTISPDDLRFAVLSGDSKAISKAPGIGGKTAQKLIIELKDKFKIEDYHIQQEDTSYFDSATSDSRQEAVLALTTLGYSQTEAMKAVRMIDNVSELDSEQILKLALKNLI